jgi:hypothetical protein
VSFEGDSLIRLLKKSLVVVMETDAVVEVNGQLKNSFAFPRCSPSG